MFLRLWQLFTISILLIQNSSATCTEMFGSDCTDGIDDHFSCVGFLEGKISNESCADLGYTVGSCCVKDFCAVTTQFVCLVAVEGTWKKEGSCGDCPTYSSCCADGLCFDDLDEVECLDRDGVMSTRPCNSGYCLEADGACCGGDTCYEMPEEFCTLGHYWYEGQTCEDTCYFPKPLVPPPNVSSPGRCCGLTCYEQVSESDCTYFYEYGYGCSAYPCYPQGACLRDNTCLPDSYDSLCRLTGGTFIDGGTCEYEPREPCHFVDGRCVYRRGSECDLLGGFHGEEYAECEWTSGACCSVDGEKECVVTQGPSCAPVNEVFFENATCSLSCQEMIDQENNGLCCVHDFCFPGILKDICVQKANGYYNDSADTCPSRGVCGNADHLDLSNVTIEDIPITVNDITISIQTSSLSITSINTNGTTFGIANSSLISGPIDIKQSTLSFSLSSVIITTLNTTKSRIILDTNSHIEITGCLNLGTESTISVQISSAQNEELKDNEDGLQLMSFDCVEGEANYELLSDSEDCYRVQTGATGLFLFLDSCPDTSFSVNYLTIQLMSLSLVFFL